MLNPQKTALSLARRFPRGVHEGGTEFYSQNSHGSLGFHTSLAATKAFSRRSPGFAAIPKHRIFESVSIHHRCSKCFKNVCLWSLWCILMYTVYDELYLFNPFWPFLILYIHHKHDVNSHINHQIIPLMFGTSFLKQFNSYKWMLVN